MMVARLLHRLGRARQQRSALPRPDFSCVAVLSGATSNGAREIVRLPGRSVAADVERGADMRATRAVARLVVDRELAFDGVQQRRPEHWL